jgi:hypothetical protein
MRAHIIENGIVTNTIEVESLDFMPNLISGETGSIGWLWDGETLTPPPAPEPSDEDRKLIGTLINGVMCSATKDDQNGLSALAVGVTLARMSGQAFPATQFSFSNGSKLVITDDNFDSIYSQWVPFRQSFFAATL